DRIVVLDPPTTTAARDQLAAAECGALDLVFGAREARFSADALRVSLDVRAALADTYRHLRDSGPARGPVLAALLRDGGAHPRSTAAIVHGLQQLLQRGLLEVDGSDGLRLAERTAEIASPAP